MVSNTAARPANADLALTIRFYSESGAMLAGAAGKSAAPGLFLTA